MKSNSGRKGKNDEWQTSRDLFLHLSSELGGFDLDAAATTKNTLVDGEEGTDYFTKNPSHSAFTREWGREDRATQFFCNPPYSNVGPWVRRARDAVISGYYNVGDHREPVRGAMLIKSEVTSVWWQESLVAAPLLNYMERDVFIGATWREGWFVAGMAQKAQILTLSWAETLHLEIRFPRGRIRFEGAKAGAPFPVALVLMRRPGDFFRG